MKNKKQKPKILILKVPKELLNKSVVIGEGCKGMEYDVCGNIYETELKVLFDILNDEIKKFNKLKSDLRKRNFKVNPKQLKEYGEIIDLHYCELTNEVDL